MGIGTMTRGEKAVIFVTSQYLTKSPFMPGVEDVDEIHFDVELVHFIQVCRPFSFANHGCLFIHAYARTLSAKHMVFLSFWTI